MIEQDAQALIQACMKVTWSRLGLPGSESNFNEALNEMEAALKKAHTPDCSYCNKPIEAGGEVTRLACLASPYDSFSTDHYLHDGPCLVFFVAHRFKDPIWTQP